jgi:hypothetical protein
MQPRPCPKCGKEISTLKMYEDAEFVRMPYLITATQPQEIGWDQVDTITEDKEIDFECPECNEILFTDQETAEKWLLDPTSVITPQWTNKFYNVLRITREDIAASVDEAKLHLQEAARFLLDWEVERIAMKIGDSLMDQGDYHIAIEIISEDYLESAFKKNKKAILELVRQHPELSVCPICEMENVSDKDLKFLKGHGQCETCSLEDSESEGVENAIRSTTDSREIEAAQERTDMIMDKADKDEKATEFDKVPDEETDSDAI